MIPQDFIADLLARTDLVDLVDSYVPLKKAGANYAACCPFHSEKTPSFTVSPTKQFYHCFGCGANGSAIAFIMQYQGVDFFVAVHELAGRLGLEVPEQRGTISNNQPKDTRGQIADMTEIMSRAAEFYRSCLKDSSDAINYLKQREVSGEIAARYGLGYAPRSPGLKAVFKNYDDKHLQTAGLVIKNDKGSLYDRFRERVIFPIKNVKGEVIAFGGRIIGTGEPKYLNSPETPLFEKGRELFGLPEARKSLRANNQALVVEGYMDVISLTQHGVENVIATLGTATTSVQIQKLLRQADSVIFCFDGDIAGKKAAWRALENALGALADHKRISFVFLPADSDPDSYIRSQGKDAFQRLLIEATPLSNFMLNELEVRSPASTAEGRAALLREAKPLLKKIRAPALRLQIIKSLAQKTSFSQNEIERLCDLRGFARQAPSRIARHSPTLVRTLLRLCLQDLNQLKKIPVHLLDNSLESKALRAMITTADNLLMPANQEASTDKSKQQAMAINLSYPLLLERLRGSPEAALIEQQAAIQLQNSLSEDELVSELDSALERLGEHGQKRQWQDLHDKVLKQGVGGLSSAEKASYLQLIDAGHSKKITTSSS